MVTALIQLKWRSSECTHEYAQKRLDTADIVRDAPVPDSYGLKLRIRDFLDIVKQMNKHYQLGTFELIVLLALIRLGDDAYGISISHEIETRGSRRATIGSIYSTLNRLESKGLVCSEIGESTPERGGRAKKYFRVTVKGRREVRETQRILTRLSHALPEPEGARP